MAEPKFEEMIVEPYESELKIPQGDANCLLNFLSDARVSAAYWQGRCEGLELLIASLKEGHAREIDGLVAAHDTLVSYLKDRLNRLEVGHGSKADS